MDSRDGRYGCTCPGCLMDTVRAVQDMPNKTMDEDRYKIGYRQAILDVLDFLDSKIDSPDTQIGDLMKSITRLFKVMGGK